MIKLFQNLVKRYVMANETLSNQIFYDIQQRRTEKHNQFLIELDKKKYSRIKAATK